MPASKVLSGLGRAVLLCGVGLLAANCSGSKLSSKIDPKYGVAASPRVVEPGQPVPKGGGVYSVGKPYVVAGKTYTPRVPPKGYKAQGLASWYGDDFHGRLTANGEVFDMDAIAAANPTLPLPSYVRVTNLGNGRSMVVRVNDRGPFHGNRMIDVSRRAADMLGFKSKGTARVQMEYLGPAPLEGSSDVQLAATFRQNGEAPAPSVMVASAGPLPGHVASAPANVPLPPSRPFDLGESGPAVAYARPAYVPSKPRAVAVAVPEPVAKPRPVRVASVPAPQIEMDPSAPPAGWVVGAQPAMGYASEAVVTPVGSGRGLY
ncbi:septal ring lytic transglycosylase RlpA family protein [Ancylobacter sp. MQZ15Z-1]|uniref:Endolytic peptidoglycan transglycosylase RlpA n=1 Tax=Ancylobacter mangrovi TaxID=2972472 RepID=A0A9X2T342_9HYPH|nr:septal ring lytic transglycosylase RlpA family protein [Ancylobacter mangrovi]MCS0496925.1 septal ring lytic transglycosylase RlpA family protein [Ancylobacter mangrovi]